MLAVSWIKARESATMGTLQPYDSEPASIPATTSGSIPRLERHTPIQAREAPSIHARSRVFAEPEAWQDDLGRSFPGGRGPHGVVDLRERARPHHRRRVTLADATRGVLREADVHDVAPRLVNLRKPFGGKLRRAPTCQRGDA